MELYFNELSCNPLAITRELALKRLSGLQLLIKKACTKGFKTVRCPDRGCCEIKLCEDYTVADYVNDNPRDSRAIFLLGVIHPPYLKPDSKEEDRFIGARFTVSILEDDKTFEADSYGLAAAYLNSSIGLNLASSKFWSDNKKFCLNEYYEGKLNVHDVYSFSAPSDFDSEYFFKWQVLNRERKFLCSRNACNNKKCNLSSDHHGNNLLKEFAKNSLFPLPYITEVVTSIAYTPKFQHFVKSIDETSNRIEVVLYWTENGYGMVLQTNAKDKVELFQMADELEKKFCK